ncbi:MAG: type II toxin-antitoxin system VapC family toxin [Campylobacterales bacterium]
MRAFLDANIILDLIDRDRKSVDSTKEAIAHLIQNSYELYTSCDIFTTVYYVTSKHIESKVILEELEKILLLVNVIPIDIKVIKESIEIAKERGGDLEDVLQYVCAKKEMCELIVSNDKSFYRDSIEVVEAKSVIKMKSR